jgi:hypothetical protein
MADTDLRAKSARNNSNVVDFPEQARRLRSDVPPFDPTNPSHIAAWESLWDFGQAELKYGSSERDVVAC